MKKIKIISVVGARPNFVKIAPFLRELNKHEEIFNILVHTGQHYTDCMADVFFRDFKISKFIGLNIAHGSAREQIAEIKTKFNKVLLKENPDLVVVVGDVNSTRACALAAAKLKIKVAHIEAGLRSFDKTMPEEANRIIADSVSDFLFVTEPSGIINLKREGVSSKRIFFAGNIMIDSLVNHLAQAKKRKMWQRLGLRAHEYAILTLHRPSNVDNKARFRKIINALIKIQQDTKIVYPIHPRTAKMLKRFGLLDLISTQPNIKIINPLGYIDFLSLMVGSKFVMTDSGGMQEETTYLGILCFTLRKNTERPVTLKIGTSVLVGDNYNKLCRLIKSRSKRIKAKKIKFWDGKTAARIVKVLRANVLPAQR